MSKLGLSLCRKLIAEPSLELLQDTGLNVEMFKGTDKRVFAFITDHYKNYGKMPEWNTVLDEVEIDADAIPEAREPASYYADSLVRKAAIDAQREWMKKQAQALDSRDPVAVIDAAKGMIREGLETYRIGGGTLVNLRKNGPERLAAYEKLKTYEKGIKGVKSLWQILDEATLGWQAGQLISCVARLGVGKCVAAGTRIPDPVTGHLRKIEDVVRERRPALTFSKQKGIVPGLPSAWVATGDKECLELKTRLGYRITVTPEHPMLTSRGWVRADELTLADSVVSVARIPEPLETVSQALDEIAFLAVMLSEGGITGDRVSFSTADPEYASFVGSLAEGLWMRSAYRSNYDYDFVPKARAREILGKFRLTHEKAIHKRVPQEVFQLPDDDLAHFLRIFWWGDGGKDATIGLASEGLIDDIQHLLLRFGVVTRKRYKRATCNGKAFDSWALRVEAWTRGRFRTLMAGMPGEKGATIAQIPDPQNPNTDNVPVTSEMVSEIRRASDTYRVWKCPSSDRRGLYTDTAARLGRTNPRQAGLRDFTAKNGKASVGRSTFRALIDTAGGLLESFRWLVREDIVFVPLVGIRQVGVKTVFDLTMADTSCFVAENLVAHNTWWAVLNANAAQTQGKKVGFISPEMTAEEIGQRRDAVRYKLPYEDFKRGQLDQENEARFREAVERAFEDEESDFIVAADERVETVADVDLFVEENGVEILIVDGAYLLQEPKAKNDWERVTKIIRGLKKIARKRKIPIVVLVQFRKSVKTGQMVGHSEDIAFTDAIGQDSDVVVALFQNDDMKQASPPQMTQRLIKNREGKQIEFTTAWDFVSMNFDVLAEEDVLEVPKEAPSDGGGGAKKRKKRDEDIPF